MSVTEGIARRKIGSRNWMMLMILMHMTESLFLNALKWMICRCGIIYGSVEQMNYVDTNKIV